MTTTTRRMVAAATAAGLATAGMVTLAQTGAHATDAVTVDVAPGDALALRLAGCRFERRPGSLVALLRDPSDVVAAGPLDENTGNVVVTVPNDQAPGNYRMRVDCPEAYGGKQVVPVTVHPEPWIVLAATSVPAGSSLRVSGRNCRGSTAAIVTSYRRSNIGSDVLPGTFVAGTDARWFSIGIPANEPPGTHQVKAICNELFLGMGGALYKTSQWMNVEVTAAPPHAPARHGGGYRRAPTEADKPKADKPKATAKPVAVVAAPRFTG